MKPNTDNKIVNKSYGFLTLRGGVFLNACGSVLLTPLIPASSSSDDFVSRYFHFRVPGIESTFDTFLVVSFAMNAVGLWGCYKKSKKLIKYHKRYCYYELVCTPLVVGQSLLYSYWGVRKILDEKNASWESFIASMKEEYSKYVFVAFGAFMGTCFAHMAYAAYVAGQYEKYLENEAATKKDDQSGV
ncbi:uncharacterized protein ATC70_000324 [Mucor velutinosus]|uniref:Uncharacterized protein n=1 Tax=Mucor velutinosus TaxID=708070 RepID=A0AAN7I1G3_9FUNG|nr:hypothetical protein ATC70_000324 [Mucor velutinosus]